LCDGLADLPEIAAHLQAAMIADYSGSWSDAEREGAGNAGDLLDGVALSQEVRRSAHDVFDATEAVSVGIATPLHAVLALTDVTPADPSTLPLSPDESRVLCGVADAHMREVGVRLHFMDTGRWALTCNRAVEVLTERPDWIVGELLRPNLPRGRDARLVERWMNELQMLLHTHPVNVAREERRLPPVNLVWLWAFGALDTNNEARDAGAALPRPTSDIGSVDRGTAASKECVPHLQHLHALRNGDMQAWQNAWQTVSPEILSAQTIILGDSRPRLRLTIATPSLASRLFSRFKRKGTLAEALTQLQRSL
jgi:hypothetical protein